MLGRGDAGLIEGARRLASRRRRRYAIAVAAAVAALVAGLAVSLHHGSRQSSVILTLRQRLAALERQLKPCPRVVTIGLPPNQAHGSASTYEVNGSRSSMWVVSAPGRVSVTTAPRFGCVAVTR